MLSFLLSFLKIVKTVICFCKWTLNFFKGALCKVLTILKHKNTIICLQIFKKHAKLTLVYLEKKGYSLLVILLWECRSVFWFVKPAHCQFTQLYFSMPGCQLAENTVYFISFIVMCARSCWCRQSGNLRAHQVWGGAARWKNPLQQGPSLLLAIDCPAKFSSNSNQTHLKQLRSSGSLKNERQECLISVGALCRTVSRQEQAWAPLFYNILNLDCNTQFNRLHTAPLVNRRSLLCSVSWGVRACRCSWTNRIAALFISSLAKRVRGATGTICRWGTRRENTEQGLSLLNKTTALETPVLVHRYNNLNKLLS